MDLHGGNIYKLQGKGLLKKSKILDFSASINPMGVPSGLKKAIIDSLDDLINYPDPDYTSLTESISKYTGVKEDMIIPGNGATEIIFLYGKALKPLKTLIVNPTFSEYERAFKIYGSVDYFRLEEENDFILNKEQLEDELKKNYSLLVICNPNNPTGNFLDKGLIEEIVMIAGMYNTFVMIDESFIEFVNFGSSSIPLINKYNNLIIIRSLSAFFPIPGLRLGYGLSGNREFLRKMKQYKEPWSINNFASLGGEILLTDWDYMFRTIEWIKKERDFFYSEMVKIKNIKCYKPSANFMLMKIENNLTAGEVREKLIKKDILIRDASNFPFLNEKFIRTCIKERYHNQKLIQEFKEIFG